MKTLCTWLLQYFSTYNYIMKLCRYKKFAKVKIKFTLLKNVFFKLVETSRAGIHWRQIPACFFSRFSMAFIYTVSDTARTVINFIKSIFQNVARNQSWKEFSFLLFFYKFELLALFTLFAAKICQEMPKDQGYGFILRRLRASFSAKRLCFLFTKCLKLRAGNGWYKQEM